jgi:hypothetical protein
MHSIEETKMSVASETNYSVKNIKLQIEKSLKKEPKEYKLVTKKSSKDEQKTPSKPTFQTHPTIEITQPSTSTPTTQSKSGQAITFSASP